MSFEAPKGTLYEEGDWFIASLEQANVFTKTSVYSRRSLLGHWCSHDSILAHYDNRLLYRAGNEWLDRECRYCRQRPSEGIRALYRLHNLDLMENTHEQYT